MNKSKLKRINADINTNRKYLDKNDVLNNFLKKLLYRSYENRAAIYGEGGRRLSNDHDITMYYRWPKTGLSFWADVPCFSSHAIRMFPEAVVLDLGCANGWYYRNFYYKWDNLEYYGYDLSDDTINEAKSQLANKERFIGKKLNAHFGIADILEDENIYDIDATNVLMYAVINMFDRDGRRKIYKNIANCLENKKGIFAGGADLKVDNKAQWDRYIGLYECEDELRQELEEHFKNVFIAPVKRMEELRMFMASNGELPFYNRK